MAGPGVYQTGTGSVTKMFFDLQHSRDLGGWGGREVFQRVHSGDRIEFTNYGVEKKNLRS